MIIYLINIALIELAYECNHQHLVNLPILVFALAVYTSMSLDDKYPPMGC